MQRLYRHLHHQTPYQVRNKVSKLQKRKFLYSEKSTSAQKLNWDEQTKEIEKICSERIQDLHHINRCGGFDMSFDISSVPVILGRISVQLDRMLKFQEELLKQKKNEERI